MGRQVAVVLYVVAMAAVFAGGLADLLKPLEEDIKRGMQQTADLIAQLERGA